ASHMAYADFLVEQADPTLQARGEFIQVQLALEDESRPPGERKKLQQREKALLREHQSAWLGELARFLGKKPRAQATLFTVARGWLDTLQVHELNVTLARVLARAPQTRLLRKLVILDCPVEGSAYPPGADLDPYSVRPAMSALRSARYLGNVRVF